MIRSVLATVSSYHSTALPALLIAATASAAIRLAKVSRSFSLLMLSKGSPLSWRRLSNHWTTSGKPPTRGVWKARSPAWPVINGRAEALYSASDSLKLLATSLYTPKSFGTGGPATSACCFLAKRTSLPMRSSSALAASACSAGISRLPMRILAPGILDTSIALASRESRPFFNVVGAAAWGSGADAGWPICLTGTALCFWPSSTTAAWLFPKGAMYPSKPALITADSNPLRSDWGLTIPVCGS